MSVECRICRGPSRVFSTLPKRSLYNKPVREPKPGAVADMRLGFCDSCRHISAHLQSDFPLEHLKEEVYGELYANFVPTELSPNQTAFTNFVADWLARRLPSRQRVLEIGCHDGYYLNRLKSAGHQCVGVEPSPFADYATKMYGLEVRKEFFDASMFGDASFDVIVLRHVLEHVDHPAKLLGDALRVLKPGGFLYVEVPNSLWSLQERYYPEFHVDHLSYFTPQSMQTMLQGHGLDVSHLETFTSYMRFPFMGALCRKAPNAKAATTDWMLDFGIQRSLDAFQSGYKHYVESLRATPTEGLAVWGAGSIGTQYAIDGGWKSDEGVYVDINPANQNLRLSVSGHRVHPPQTLLERPPKTLLIASGWEDDVRRQSAPFIERQTQVLGFHGLVG